MEVTKRQHNESAREYAYREICRNIVSLNFLPGSEISVQKIAEILGISRTPVREAFLELQERDPEKAQQALCNHLCDYSAEDQQKIRLIHPEYFRA